MLWKILPGVLHCFAEQLVTQRTCRLIDHENGRYLQLYPQHICKAKDYKLNIKM